MIDSTAMNTNERFIWITSYRLWIGSFCLSHLFVLLPAMIDRSLGFFQ
jgi:hypothetical protein